MATEDIIIRYRADVSQLEQDLNKLEKSQQDLLDTTRRQSQEVQRSVNAQAVAQKKRAELLNVERQRVEKLREAQKLAFDPVAIDKYNKAIAESTRRIELLEGRTRQVGNNTDEVFNRITNTAQRVAGALGIAFSLESVIAFGQQAVNAFIEAEKSAKRLEGAVVGFGGESIESFEALNNQAELLGATTLESADSIRKAQITLSNFGLNASQISQILPGLIGQAKRTGESLDSFASRVGSALQGTGKQFQLLGANIDTNKTQLENYNELLRALSDESQNATLSTEELTDSLALQQKQIDDLTTQIGGELAPGWIAAKKAALEYVASVLNVPTIGKQVAAESLPSIQAETQARIEQLRAEGKETSDIIGFLRGDLDRAKAEAETAGQNFKNVQDEFGGVLATLTKLTDSNFRIIAKVRLEGASVAKEIAEANVATLQQQIDGLNSERELKEKTLGLDKIKLLTSKQLQEELTKNQQENDLASRTNVTNLEKEIEARKQAGEKARQEAERTAQARKQLQENLVNELRTIQNELQTKQIELIEPTSFAEAVDKIEQLRDLNKQFVDEDINLKIAQAKANNTLTKEAQELFESIRQGRKDLIDQKSSKDILTLEQTTIEQLAKLREDARKIIASTNIDDLAKQTEEQGKKFEEVIANVEKGIGIAQREQAEKDLAERFFLVQKSIIAEREARIAEVRQQALIQEKSVKDSATAEEEKKVIRLNASKEIKKITEDAQKQLDQAGDSYDEATDKLGKGVLDFVSQNAQALQQVGAILGEIANLYDQFAEKRIEQIEAEKDAQLSAIDEQLAKDEETLELKRISEEEAYARKKSLEEQKVKLEEEAAKKIREIKRKQAILDKANALFQIAINTAQALASLENLKSAGILTPLILALSGLQAAAVISQPIPYRKGSKDTGSKGHMARVGEEGEEIVYMPSHSKVLPARQTREYSEILDAMFDNNLNKYIAKTYVAPALQRQKVAYENDRQSSFAENISKSIYYNGGLSANDLEKVRRKGQPITNVDEIAKAIASKLPTYDPYRR